MLTLRQRAGLPFLGARLCGLRSGNLFSAAAAAIS